MAKNKNESAPADLASRTNDPLAAEPGGSTTEATPNAGGAIPGTSSTTPEENGSTLESMRVNPSAPDTITGPAARTPGVQPITTIADDDPAKGAPEPHAAVQARAVNPNAHACVNRYEDALQRQGSRLAKHGFSLDDAPSTFYVATEKVEGKRGAPVILAAHFCPFCGEKL